MLEKWLSEEQEALLLSCSDDGEDFHRRRYDVVVGVRFLEKTFLPQMAEMVRPGGFLVYSTFADGAQYMKGPKNLNRIVMKGELARAFGGDKGFLVLIDRIEHSEDGRPLNCFLARKLK